MLGGLGLAFVPGLPHIQLEPDLVLLVFLPPLLFSAAAESPIRDLRANLVALLRLSLGLVLLFIGLFAIGPVWLSLIIAGLVIGAIWGAIFGFVAHWTTRGQRDFSSTKSIVAARYEVSVADAYLERAQQLLSSLG